MYILLLTIGGIIDNIQVSWVKEGFRIAQLLLSAGVNDLGGTLMNESISTSAGASYGQLATPAELQSIIYSAGRIPVERFTDYKYKQVFNSLNQDQKSQQQTKDTNITNNSHNDKTHKLDNISLKDVESIFGSYHGLTQQKTQRYKDYVKQQRQLTNQHSLSSNSCINEQKRDYSTILRSQFNGIKFLSTTRNFYNLNQNQTQQQRQQEHTHLIPITYSSSFTIVPTYECYNSCQYCNFRKNIQVIY